MDSPCRFLTSLLPFLLLLVCLPLMAAQKYVLDSDGQPLLRGRLYYAQSLLSKGGAGGLILVAANESCPTHVAKAGFRDWRGQALAFFPENPDSRNVGLGETVNIRFAARPSCSARSSALWQVSDWRVTTGGSVSGGIGPHRSRFEISRSEAQDAYQIVSCPCSKYCRMACWGPVAVGESGLLTLDYDMPHLVVFVKA